MTFSTMKRIAIMAWLAPLAACGGLRSKDPVEQIYLLRPAPAAVAASDARPLIGGALTLRRPEVQPGYDNDRIALVRAGNQLDHYAASRWGAPLSQVIDAFATQTLLSSGRFDQVSGSESGNGGARFLLALTVRHFEADYTAGENVAPTVHVAFECMLLMDAIRKPLGHCHAEASVPATENRMGPIVQAFEAAARQAMEQVEQQVVRLAEGT
jgi:cholesterol transport system auxiliary component